MSKEFWMVVNVADAAGLDTHGAAVLKAQEYANRKPGQVYAIGHFKEAWSIPKTPAAQIDLSQEMPEEAPEFVVDAFGVNEAPREAVVNAAMFDIPDWAANPAPAPRVRRR